MTEPQLFHLQRDRDVSGVSGTGRVADGVQWADGTATVRWLGDRPSTVHWERLADAIAVHGHGGATRLVWAVPQPPTADQTALRDRIAEALMRWAEGNNSPKYASMRRPETVVQNAYSRADAVLAVLPATAEIRAAAFREAADIVGNDDTCDCGGCDSCVPNARATELRRLAKEALPTEAHEPLHQWRVEILDGDEWMPASGLRRDRSQVVDQLRMSSERRPLWNDGTRVQRRIVRETTTYTVEAETGPAAGARQDGAQR